MKKKTTKTKLKKKTASKSDKNCCTKNEPVVKTSKFRKLIDKVVKSLKKLF